MDAASLLNVEGGELAGVPPTGQALLEDEGPTRWTLVISSRLGYPAREAVAQESVERYYPFVLGQLRK